MPRLTRQTKKKLAYLGFHPPCSPDLPPSDNHLFPVLKKQLKVRHSSSDAEVIAAAKTFWIFLSDFQKLEQWAKKCTELRGEYDE